MTINQLLSGRPTETVKGPVANPVITWHCSLDRVQKTEIKKGKKYTVLYFRRPWDPWVLVEQGLVWNVTADPYIGRAPADDIPGGALATPRFYFDGHKDPDEKFVLCVVEDQLFQRSMSRQFF